VSRLAFDGKAGKLQLALSLGLLDSGSADAVSEAWQPVAIGSRIGLPTSERHWKDSASRRTPIPSSTYCANWEALEAGEEGTERDTGFAGCWRQTSAPTPWLSAAVALAKMTDARIHAQLVRLQRELERSQREHLDTPRTTPRSLHDFYAQNDEGHDPL
jgi:hypothetical protein